MFDVWPFRQGMNIPNWKRKKFQITSRLNSSDKFISTKLEK